MLLVHPSSLHRYVPAVSSRLTITKIPCCAHQRERSDWEEVPGGSGHTSKTYSIISGNDCEVKVGSQGNSSKLPTASHQSTVRSASWPGSATPRSSITPVIDLVWSETESNVFSELYDEKCWIGTYRKSFTTWKDTRWCPLESLGARDRLQQDLASLQPKDADRDTPRPSRPPELILLLPEAPFFSWSHWQKR